MWDAHIHIGRFRDLYFDPVKVAADMISFGIEKWIVSSTTLSEGVGSFDDSLREIDSMESAAPGRTIPFLWVTPEMVNNLEYYIDRRFYGMKIHARAQHWSSNGDAIQEVAKTAAKKNIPLMLHTGGDENCDAGAYLDLCCSNPSVQFILAHGRPVDQALRILDECPNTVVDTAFMPIEDLVMLVENGKGGRILFGSDYPLQQVFFSHDSKENIYRSNIDIVSKVAPMNIFCDNIHRIIHGAWPCNRNDAAPSD